MPFPAGDLGADTIDGRGVDRHLGWSPFTWPMNLTGAPAITLPCGIDPEGLPVGLQIVAPWLGEAVLFRVAAAFETAKPWSQNWPALLASFPKQSATFSNAEQKLECRASDLADARSELTAPRPRTAD
jgi:hypothetical protein